MRKNSKLYLPYSLACIGMTAMFYILMHLAYSPALELLSSSGEVSTILRLGSFVIGVFSLLFLFYTNSFLVRRRYKEFGLYNVLGMNKGNISRVLAWESLINALISLVGGLFLGIALSKLAELGLVNIMGGKTDLNLRVSVNALEFTTLFYCGIFLLIYLNSLIKIRRSSASELVKSENFGEKPPRANWLFGLAGIVILAAAYYIAVSIKTPLTALSLFFIAVIMVIIGTYLLMIFGSVLLCRFLQKRKNYYYKPNHFISVSSMTYRMKRNGAGLASVCVLATMVLVMISSTTCLLFGAEDSVNTRYPRDIVLSTGFDTIDGLDDGNIEKVAAGVDSLAASHKANASNFASYRSVVTVGTISDGGKLIAGGTGVTIGSNSNAYICFDVVPIEDYNAVMGTNETLAPDEVIVYGYRMKYKYDTVTLGDGKTYKVKKTADSFLVDGDSAVNIASSIYIFVPDFKSAATDFAKPEHHNGVRTVNYKYFRFFDTDLDTAGERALCNDYIDATKPVMSSYGNMMTFSIDSRNVGRDDYYSTFGSLFYLGVMLSVVFIFAAVLIIYYKQVSEGYEDQSRFEIMQKVGMTKKEIRKSINSQLLTVFFLPLAGAGLHMIFASIIIRRILLAFNFNNPVLFAVTTLVCFVVFALFYTLIYRVTSNAYYKIVSGAKERD